MKTYLKIIGEVVVGFGCLFGLYSAHVITSEIAITVGMLSFVFILCFEEVNKQLYPLTNAMAELQHFLSKNKKFKFIPLHQIKPNSYVQENSPLMNTPLGLQLLEASGGKKIVDDHYSEYESQINQRSCPTAYDVQIVSSEIIAEAQDLEYMKPVKDFVYTNPKYNNIPLELDDAQRVMVVYLRDKYLDNHPQIKPDYEPPTKQQG